MNEVLYQKTLLSRDKLFESLGTVDSDVLAPLVNPSFTGGPTWPSIRQAYTVIRTNNSLMVTSNGLSDPFNDTIEDNNGFAIEVLAETENIINKDDLNEISQSWIFQLVSSVSQEVAYNGQIKSYIEQYDVVTMEIALNHSELSLLQNDKGMVGIMLGVEHPRLPKKIKFPAEDIILLTVKVLTPEELDYVTEYRAEGRKNLHKQFQNTRSYHYCDLNRQSLVPDKKKRSWWEL